MSEIYSDIVVGVKEKFEKTGEVDHDSLLTAGYLNNNFNNINGERSIMVMSALHIFDCNIKAYKARLFSDIRNGSDMITKDVLVEANAIKSRMTDEEIEEVCMTEIVTPWTTSFDYNHIFEKINTGHFPKKGKAGSDIEILFPFTIAEVYKLDIREVLFQIVMTYKRGEAEYSLRAALDKFSGRDHNKKHFLYRNILDGSSFDGNSSAYKLEKNERNIQLETRQNVGVIQTSGKTLESSFSSLNNMGDWMTRQKMVEFARRNDEVITSYLPEKKEPDRGGMMMPTPEKMLINEELAKHCKTGLTFKGFVILAAFGTVAVVVFAIFAVLPIFATAFSFFAALVFYAMLALVFLLVIFILFDKDQVVDISMASLRYMNGALKEAKGIISPPNPNSLASTNPEVDKTLKNLNANAEQTGEVLNGLWSFGKGIIQGFTSKGKKI